MLGVLGVSAGGADSAQVAQVRARESLNCLRWKSRIFSVNCAERKESWIASGN